MNSVLTSEHILPVYIKRCMHPDNPATQISAYHQPYQNLPKQVNLYYTTKYRLYSPKLETS